MSKAKREKIKQIKKTVKKYIDFLEANDFSVSQVYIFGSFARGDFHQNSDIDVAIVSNKFTRDWDKNEQLLWKMRRKIDPRIEPVGYKLEDFKISDPLVQQIKEYGIRVK